MLAVASQCNAAPQRGACCSTKLNSHCIDSQLIGDCVSKFSGVYLGDGKRCSDNMCQTLPGACCPLSAATKGQCRDNVPLKDCHSKTSHFGGFGSKCGGEGVCPSFAAHGARNSTSAIITGVTQGTKYVVSGRVRDSKTRRPLADAVVVLMNRNHVRVAEAKTNANGQYEISIPVGEATDAHAPFNVVLSEKSAHSVKNKRCSRSPSSKTPAVSYKHLKISSRTNKHVVRDIEASCSSMKNGAALASHKSRATVQTGHAHQSKSGLIDVTPVNMVMNKNTINARHLGSEYDSEDDDDNGSNNDDSDDDDDSHHGRRRHHHHSTTAVVIGIIIGALALCCLLSLCLYAVNNYNEEEGSGASAQQKEQGVPPSEPSLSYFGKRNSSKLGQAISSRRYSNKDY